ncbi:MarR family winged helix-turn-helix transcriptional regulator [Demequina sp. NBRC 110054]|uniref:MarR family winged helix-turn-helix transcriptional regulator n=1 Tax=Demequina sp. NBRC 110054 TaxID=1570343 RepID=UPI000A020E38|nr:MarR family winged helix-turn-helix transcriptional regulator [Demequina sp. NBRC 110054]
MSGHDADEQFASDDAIDAFVAEWHRERPGLDTEALEIFGRLSRYARLVSVMNERVLAAHDLQPWELEVLEALTRQGTPHRLTAGDIERLTLITSGTTTHRIGRLERRGYVRRVRDDRDKRIVWVALTDAGHEACLEGLDAMLDGQRRALDMLEPDARDALRSGLESLGQLLRDEPPTLRSDEA